ncbi:hypothetical protein AN189_07915 [Loktanella sp. 3ANDIMAR09]|nr:hypothetical protein AN189_07915 [Loktanella sp. 3ANDIMAR09]
MCLAACTLGTAALSQDNAGGHVAIELNAVQPVDTACQISFVVKNSHAADIDQAVFEAVLFDTDGRVAQMTLFDFGTLPADRPRVRQFVVPGLACPSLGRLLINGAETCTGDALPAGACETGLALHSRTDIEVLG